MKKTAVLFPGQGSQYVGMGKKQLINSDIASLLFNQASNILGYDLQQLCFNGSINELTDTAITQPAVFVTSVAIYETLKSNLPIPQFMAGHSLGEYTALTCSGALEFIDALQIVQKRGILMKQAVTGSSGIMAAVNNIDATVLEQVCESVSRRGNLVSVAAYNSSVQFVISGHIPAIDEVSECCRKLGAIVTRLKVSAPFHCSLMDSAAIEINAELQKYTLKTPCCKILSNVTGEPYKSTTQIIDGLTKQMTYPVKWLQSLQYLVTSQVGYFVEAGPGKVLKNILKKDLNIGAYSMDDDRDMDQLPDLLAKNIKTLSTTISKSLGISMSIKNRNFNALEYHEGVIEPYREIKQLQNKLEAEQLLPTVADINHAVTLFCKILNAKKVEKQEKLYWLEQLFSETGTSNLLPVFAPQLQ